ncbi:hypothetical protein I3843_14G132400 [Carya illinoinensis]|nr:hypothetical protein I3843_14G132400 [Carya illinoinensis]
MQLIFLLLFFWVLHPKVIFPFLLQLPQARGLLLNGCVPPPITNTNSLPPPIWRPHKEFASFPLSTHDPFPGGKGFLVSPLPRPFLHSVAY